MDPFVIAALAFTGFNTLFTVGVFLYSRSDRSGDKLLEVQLDIRQMQEQIKNLDDSDELRSLVSTLIDKIEDRDARPRRKK